MEKRNGKLAQKGTYAKMARGEMVRFMAEHQIEKAEEINSMILNRVKSSLVVGADQADEPKFTTTLLDSAKAKEVDLINGEFPFAVHAYAPDAGKITSVCI